jgi:transglutaminase-like putative cysteine protease
VNVRLTVAAAAATVLASIALYPLMSGGTWFWAGVGAVIVVAAIGAATRRRAIPAILCFAAAIAGLFVYLNVVFARHQSLAGLVPTGASVHHLRELVAQATAETSKYAPPVPDRPGIVLLTAAGIGLVAALTDVLAVRLHRPAIAGLPLLVLFCVPLTTDARPGAVGGTLVFCAGVVGYLGLLSADGRHRLRLWGRLVHPWTDEDNEGPDIRPLTAAGRRIGSAAVVLALSLPLLVPGLRQHRLFPGTGGGGPGGYHGAISFPKPLDALNAELHESRPQTILTYHTTRVQPPYLQVYVLDHLDANNSEWTMTPPADPTSLKHGTMPRAPGLQPQTYSLPVHEQIDLGRNLANSASVSYLPVPFPAQQVQVGGSWRVDPESLTVLGTNVRLAGLRYSVNAKDLNPSPQALRRAGQPPPGVEQDESVPPVYRKLLPLARRLTAHRTTDYAKAVAIQKWFTKPGNFTYSLLGVTESNSPYALQQFLTVTKTGYCQQFAFGMAVLARLVHIPARVVIGYTQGSIVATDTWQVKTSDAHAWPELYFAGVGWLRFEPTPPDSAGPAGEATAYTPPYSTPRDYVGVITSPTSGAPPQKNPSPVPTASHSTKGFIGKLRGATGGAGAAGAHQKKSAAPYAELAIVLLALLLIAPGATRFISRRWRWWKARGDAARAHVAWRELRDDLTDHRIASPASESPRALVSRITRSLGLTGAERDALEHIALAEERASYAMSPADSAKLRSDAALVRRAVSRAAGLRARWSARVAPISSLVPAREAMQHLLDVFGWMELLATKVRPRPRHLNPRETPAQT